jgi:hypothetical protein
VAEALAALLTSEPDAPPLPCRFLDQFSVTDFAVAGLADASFSWPEHFGQERLPQELRLVLDLVAHEVVPALVQGVLADAARIAEGKAGAVSERVAKAVRTQLEHAVALLNTQGWSGQSQNLVRQEIIAAILAATT